MKTAIGFLMILCLFSCSGNKTSFQNEAELEAYVNDPENGYISSVKSGDFIIETKIVPAISEDKDAEMTIHVRLSRKDGLPVLEYGNDDQQVVSEREGYLSFGILNDVYLENGDGLQPAIFSHYERNYGLKPSIDLFFQFKKFTPKTEEVTLVYRDELFQQGMFRIPFNKVLFTSCHVEE